jgi:hypothetical protein
MTRKAVAILLAVLALLVASGRDSSAQRIAACGEVDMMSGCLIFRTFEYGSIYVLPDTLALASPGIYYITAESYLSPTMCGIARDFKLRDVTVEPCRPETLGCGRILQFIDEGFCYAWESLATDAWYHLGELGGFSPGDTVMAVGLPCPSCPIAPGGCLDYGMPVLQMRLSACPGAPNPVLPSSWGAVKWKYRR